jgi:hypothetical protein
VSSLVRTGRKRRTIFHHRAGPPHGKTFGHLTEKWRPIVKAAGIKPE